MCVEAGLDPTALAVWEFREHSANLSLKFEIVQGVKPHLLRAPIVWVASVGGSTPLGAALMSNGLSRSPRCVIVSSIAPLAVTVSPNTVGSRSTPW